MPLAKIHRIQGIEDSNLQIMARIQGNDGVNVTQSSFNNVDLDVWDVKTGTNIIDDLALTITEVIFNSLQTDNRWTVDATGYNFLYDIPLAHLPNGNSTYRFEVKFTPTASTAYYVLYEVATISLFGT